LLISPEAVFLVLGELLFFSLTKAGKILFLVFDPLFFVCRERRISRPLLSLKGASSFFCSVCQDSLDFSFFSFGAPPFSLVFHIEEIFPGMKKKNLLFLLCFNPSFFFVDIQGGLFHPPSRFFPVVGRPFPIEDYLSSPPSFRSF